MKKDLVTCQTIHDLGISGTKPIDVKLLPLVGAFDFIIRCHPTSLMNLVHILFLNFMLPRNIGFHFLKVTTFNISILGEYEFFMRQRLLQSLFKIAYLLL